jgi:hypothetical protein
MWLPSLGSLDSPTIADDDYGGGGGDDNDDDEKTKLYLL